MKNTLIALLSFVLLSSLVHAEGTDSDESMIEISKPSAEFALRLEESNVDVDAGEISTVTDDRGEPISYVIEKNNGEKLVLGVSRDPGDALKGIINAYVGAQTIFGVRAGVEFLKTIQIGVHASSTGGGLFADQINRKGVHMNIVFLKFDLDENNPTVFEAVHLYAAVKYNTYAKTRREPGYYTTTLKGKTIDTLLGVHAFIDERQSVGIEIGYAQSTKNGLTKYEYQVHEIGRGFKFGEPFLCVTYVVRLFER